MAGVQRRVHAGAPRRRRAGWRRGTRWCAAEEAHGLAEGYTLVPRGGGARAGGGAHAGAPRRRRDGWDMNDVCCTRVVPMGVGGTNECMRHQSAGGTR